MTKPSRRARGQHRGYARPGSLVVSKKSPANHDGCNKASTKLPGDGPSEAAPKPMQRYLVTVQRTGRGLVTIPIGELAMAAIGEIPGVRDIQMVRHSTSEADVSFLVAADRLASVVEDRLSHFGLTWVSLQLLEVLREPDSGVDPDR
jgi:hypothetical protein